MDPDLTKAGKAINNRWLADLCAESGGRLAGQALVDFEDVDRAVADVHWAKEHGLGGIMMPGLYPRGTYFFDPRLDPLWAAIEETGLPISQHGGTGAPTYGPPGLAARPDALVRALVLLRPLPVAADRRGACSTASPV